MSDRERLHGQLAGLTEQLAGIPQHAANEAAVAYLKREIARMRDELHLVDVFEARKKELAARFYEYKQGRQARPEVRRPVSGKPLQRR